MSESSELRHRLRQLLCELDRERVDPHAQAREVLRDLQSLPPVAAEQYRETLANVVREQDDELAGVALETLISDPSERASAHLESIVRSAHTIGPLFDQALTGLLSRGYLPVKDLAVAYVRRRSDGGDLPPTLVAQLVSVASHESAEIGAKVVADRMASPAHKHQMESLTQIFLNAYLACDPSALAELVRGTINRNRAVGLDFSRTMVAQLKKPWVVQRYSEQFLDAVAADLSAASRTRGSKLGPSDDSTL